MSLEFISAVLVTERHILACSVPNRGQRLLEVLNDASTEYLPVMDARVLRLGAKHSLATLPTAVISKQRLSLAVLTDDEHEAPERRRFARISKNVHPAFVLAHGCEVRGDLHLRGQADPIAVLVHDVGNFFPLTNANVTWGCGESVQASVVLVNNSLMSVFHINESSRSRTSTANNPPAGAIETSMHD